MLDAMRARHRNQASKKEAEKLDNHFYLSFLIGAIFIGLSFIGAIGFGYSLLAAVTLVVALGLGIGSMIWHFYYKNADIKQQNHITDLLVEPESQLQSNKAQDHLEYKRRRRGQVLFSQGESKEDASLTKQDEIKYKKK